MYINSNKISNYSYFSKVKVKSSSKQEKNKIIEIIHTNDVHGNVINKKEHSGLAYVSSYLKNKWSNLNKNVLYIDSGDFLGGGDFYTQIAKGMPVVKALNKMHLDASTIGNHEFEFTSKGLLKALKKSSFDIITSNIKFNKDFKLSKELETKIRPYKIIEKDKVKIALIGLTPEELLDIEPVYKVKAVKEVEDPLISLRNTLREVKGKSDIIILVSHSGLKKDIEIAKRFPEIDIILGGHSHTLLKEPVKIGNTLIVQSGKSAKFFDDLYIQLDQSNHPYKIKHHLVSTKSLSADPEIEGIYNEVVKKYMNVANRYIKTIKGDFTRSGDRQSLLGSLVSDSIRKYTKADFSFVVSGDLRKDLKSGVVRYKDIYEVSPFLDEISVYRVKGEVIYKILEKSLKNKVYNPEQSSNFLQVSGLKVFYKLKDNSNSYEIIKLTDLNGNIIDKNKTYLVSGTSLLMNGQLGYEELKQAKLYKENVIRIDKAIEKYIKSENVENIDINRYIEVS